ncbi:MAG TPA: hypothetical protein VFW76_12485 [Ktedonobacterales bacterium]|nr:hypothetical protein [Ktedonobacterales bacterium]
MALPRSLLYLSWVLYVIGFVAIFTHLNAIILPAFIIGLILGVSALILRRVFQTAR